MGQREKLIEILSEYFTIGDSDEYSCIRDKSAFAIGTMSLDDFVEFDEEKVADIADFLLANGEVVLSCRCGECVCWDSNNISCEGFAKCLTGEGGIRYRNQNDFCSRGKRKGGGE